MELGVVVHGVGVVVHRVVVHEVVVHEVVVHGVVVMLRERCWVPFTLNIPSR